MVTEQAPPVVKFAGTKKEHELASRVHDLLRARGRFMSADAPIRVSLESLLAYLARDGAPAADAVVSALKANPAVFALEDAEGATVIVTTRAGRAPHALTVDVRHSFVRRFLTPLPKPERPVEPVRERVRVDPSWASIGALIGSLGTEDIAADDEVMEADADADSEVAVDVVGAETTATDVDEPVAPSVEVVDVVVVTAAPEPAPVRTITVPVVSGTDVTTVDDLALRRAITDRMVADARVANFGEQWMTEERVPRFSRGDLRRMREYIQEQEQPSIDGDLVQDVLGVKPNAPDFEVVRFAVNFRLAREHRDFEFVGTSHQRFWSTSGLAQIGTTRRKPNELGTDYRFLLEEAGEDVIPRSETSIDHTLTFYEYLHGLLPFDADMQRLLPAPVLPNQRSAVLTFECPQSYTTYLVELRYPTPNRGGFILGLDDFYTENLVPGALISLSRTENDGHYRVEYLAAGNQNARLLELDERRAQRYVFRPTTYACGVSDEWLLSEDLYPRFANEKPLDEKVRRRLDAVVAETFERAGTLSDGGYSLTFEHLLAVVNIERPFSANSLRSVLDKDESGAFARDTDGSDVYTYVPSTIS